MIQEGYKMDFSNQTFGVILYGAPGVGKTTLSMSDGNNGGDTLLIDLEHGIGRTNPLHRMNSKILSATTYEEVLKDLETPEAKGAKTIVIDTAGSLVEYLKDWAKRTKPGAATKSGEFNGLKGFGFVKSELDSFVNKIKVVMNKNIVFIFHADEKVDRDGNPIQRLRCEGSFRNTVWTGIDFGCLIQMQGGKRYANFAPDDDNPAKGCHGIEGKIEIPNLNDGSQNCFLAWLFDTARKNMQAENDAVAAKIAGYQQIINGVKEMVEGVTDADTANACLKAIGVMEHVLTSKKEAGKILNDKCKTLGLIYQKATGSYVAGDAQ
jgi:hypothetical protein